MLTKIRDEGKRWLYFGEDFVLIAVAGVLLIAGIFIVVNAVRGIIAVVAAQTFAESIFAVAESALLALILAELVHSLLVTLDGGSLTPEPFLVIAIVAILRKMLFTTVMIPDAQAGQDQAVTIMAEIVALSLVILVLSIALVFVRRSYSQHRTKGEELATPGTPPDTDPSD